MKSMDKLLFQEFANAFKYMTPSNFIPSFIWKIVSSLWPELLVIRWNMSNFEYAEFS